MAYPDITDQLHSLASRYHYYKPPDAVVRVQDMLRQVFQWLLEWWDSISIRLPGATDSRPLSITLTILLYGAGAIALVVLTIVLLQRVKQTANEEKGLKRGAAVVEKLLDSQGLRQEAEEYARKKDFRAACRSLYLSLLQTLHEKEIAIFAPAKTNYEYCYVLAAHSFLQSSFKELANRVELVWFGNKSADKDDYAQCLSLLDRLEPEIQGIYECKLAARQAAVQEDTV